MTNNNDGSETHTATFEVPGLDEALEAHVTRRNRVAAVLGLDPAYVATGGDGSVIVTLTPEQADALVERAQDVHMAALAGVEYLEGGGVRGAKTWNPVWLTKFRVLRDAVDFAGRLRKENP
jgi:hypothetical protein